jgi:2-C-methyl-D-erythritol 4-phosphate cytidylyltransferase
MDGHVGAVIPAAGLGRRLGGSVRKALVPVAGQPLLLHSLRACDAAEAIGSIVIAAHADDVPVLQRMVQAERLSKVTAVVEGGVSRAASVAAAIAALPAEAAWVAVHDAARPCVTPALLTATIDAARQTGAAACGLPAPMTIKSVDVRGLVRMTLDREGLWLVQTPQVGRRDWFDEALRRVRALRIADDPLAGFPDDVSLLEWAGYPVRMVHGDAWNLKVTTAEDVLVAEVVLRTRQARAAADAATTSAPVGERRPRPAW